MRKRQIPDVENYDYPHSPMSPLVETKAEEGTLGEVNRLQRHLLVQEVNQGRQVMAHGKGNWRQRMIPPRSQPSMFISSF